MEPIVLSVNDTRKALGNVGRNKVYDLINSGKLDTVQLGGRRLVKVDSIRRLLAA